LLQPKSLNYNHELIAGLITRREFFRRVYFRCADIKKCCLLCRMSAQFGHFVNAAWNWLLLFPQASALSFIPLSLLPCLLFLALRKC